LSKPVGDTFGAAVSGSWLAAGARVDKRNLFVQQEGAATVAGLDLNEGPGVAERRSAVGGGPVCTP
jgi:hypothetical protein